MVLVLPVFAAIWILGDALAGFAYLLLAIGVVFSRSVHVISGSRSTSTAVRSKAMTTSGSSAMKAIVEDDVSDVPAERTARVEAAVCVGANNRLFAVVFWFVVLGPLAAGLSGLPT